MATGFNKSNGARPEKMLWACKGMHLYLKSGRYTLVKNFKGCQRIPMGAIMGMQQYLEYLLESDLRIIEQQGRARQKDIEPRTIRLEKCDCRYQKAFA